MIQVTMPSEPMHTKIIVGVIVTLVVTLVGKLVVTIW